MAPEDYPLDEMNESVLELRGGKEELSSILRTHDYLSSEDQKRAYERAEQIAGNLGERINVLKGLVHKVNSAASMDQDASYRDEIALRSQAAVSYLEAGRNELMSWVDLLRCFHEGSSTTQDWTEYFYGAAA